MKKTLLICVFTFLSQLNFYGQGMPVYDNTNFIALGQQLISMAKQTAEVIKTVNFLREQKERIEQVSNAVRDFNTVARLIRRNQEIYGILNNDLRNLISNPLVTPNEAQRLYDRVERLYDISVEDLDLIEKILTSNFLKMEDTERMDKLREAEKRADETFSKLTIEIKDYNTIVQFREFQQAVDNARN